jgi:hypothetical protein
MRHTQGKHISCGFPARKVREKNQPWMDKNFPCYRRQAGRVHNENGHSMYVLQWLPTECNKGHNYKWSGID